MVKKTLSMSVMKDKISKKKLKKLKKVNSIPAQQVKALTISEKPSKAQRKHRNKTVGTVNGTKIVPDGKYSKKKEVKKALPLITNNEHGTLVKVNKTEMGKSDTSSKLPKKSDGKAASQSGVKSGKVAKLMKLNQKKQKAGKKNTSTTELQKKSVGNAAFQSGVKSGKIAKLMKLDQKKQKAGKINTSATESTVVEIISKPQRRKLRKLKRLGKLVGEMSMGTLKKTSITKKNKRKKKQNVSLVNGIPNMSLPRDDTKEKTKGLSIVANGTGTPSKKNKRVKKKQKKLQQEAGLPGKSALKKADESVKILKKKDKKKDKNKTKNDEHLSEEAQVPESGASKNLKRKKKLYKLLLEAESGVKSGVDEGGKNTLHNLKKKRQKDKSTPSLRETMTEQLKSSLFRLINEQLYQSTSSQAAKFFKDDPKAFEAYHAGYKNQVDQWPLNPLEWIIKSVSSAPAGTVIADLGCGEARLAESLPQFKVHSFDFIAEKPGVVACDMAHTPLLVGSADIAVFCLSLMGTNLNDFLLEANRILKVGGLLKIAEVESRFDDVDNFTSELQHFGFQLKKKDFSNQLFYFMEFKKTRNVSKTNKLPVVKLEPCLYKKR